MTDTQILDGLIGTLAQYGISATRHNIDIRVTQMLMANKESTERFHAIRESADLGVIWEAMPENALTTNG